jgi:hypothetical protein
VSHWCPAWIFFLLWSLNRGWEVGVCMNSTESANDLLRCQRRVLIFSSIFNFMQNWSLLRCMYGLSLFLWLRPMLRVTVMKCT